MLRLSLRLLAEAAAGGGAAGGGGGGGNTSSASGRLVAVRKKSKWIDRRSKKIPNGGKDRFDFGEQPSCALCHVRFRFKQDYMAHKESELHVNRTRWVETQAWWKETGLPSFIENETSQWQWFEDKVLPKRAAEEGISVEEAKRKYRRAVMVDDPHWHRALQPPVVRQEIKEPKDQRWPSSPKW